MDLMFSAFAVVLFAAVILAIEGAWLWWSGNHGGDARRIARRLQLMAARTDGGEPVTILKQRRYSALPLLDTWLRRVPRVAAFDRLLLQAGANWTVARFGALQGALLLAAGSVPAVLGAPPLARLVVLAVAAVAPMLALLKARERRLRKLEQQLPEVADFLGRALRAGHSFANVLQMVGNEMPEPSGSEFRMAYEEINYGVPMNEALHNLALRIPLTDLRYMVLAVLIQRESGGNLAELLDNVSNMVRARLKLMAQVRVLSAEGRMSAWILGLLPVGVVALMALLNPGYIAVLWTDPAGVRLLWYAGGAMLAGFLWMRKVIGIRV